MKTDLLTSPPNADVVVDAAVASLVDLGVSADKVSVRKAMEKVGAKTVGSLLGLFPSFPSILTDILLYQEGSSRPICRRLPHSRHAMEAVVRADLFSRGGEQKGTTLYSATNLAPGRWEISISLLLTTGELSRYRFADLAETVRGEIRGEMPLPSWDPRTGALDKEWPPGSLLEPGEDHCDLKVVVPLPRIPTEAQLDSLIEQVALKHARLSEIATWGSAI